MTTESAGTITHLAVGMAMAFGLALATPPAWCQDTPELTPAQVEMVRAMGDATQEALQSKLVGDSKTRIADCENRWVLLPRGDGLLTLGFVYIDAEMGFTVHVQGLATDTDGVLERRPWPMEDKARLIARIPTNIAVRCLEQMELAPLSLVAEPDWLQHYADASPEGEHLTAWGRHYNRIGASAQALMFLEKAHTSGVTTEALLVELSIAYYALDRLDDAKRIVAGLPVSSHAALERARGIFGTVDLPANHVITDGSKPLFLRVSGQKPLILSPAIEADAQIRVEFTTRNEESTMVSLTSTHPRRIKVDLYLSPDGDRWEYTSSCPLSVHEMWGYPVAYLALANPRFIGDEKSICE